MKANPTSPKQLSEMNLLQLIVEDTDLNCMIALFDGELNNLDTTLL